MADTKTTYIRTVTGTAQRVTRPATPPPQSRANLQQAVLQAQKNRSLWGLYLKHPSASA